MPKLSQYQNTCEFEGTVSSDPTLSVETDKKTNKILPVLSFSISQPSVFIPLTITGTLATDLSSVIQQGDKIFVKASYNTLLLKDLPPIQTFLVYYLIFIEKQDAHMLFTV